MINYHDYSSIWKGLLTRGLEEDGWQWDWTSLDLGSQSKAPIRARIVAKSKGVWAGNSLLHAVETLSPELGASGVQVKYLHQEGTPVVPGDIVTEWQGPARQLLALERPFLNLASYASGIATATRQLVELVGKACPKNPPRVTPTRKILPAYRDLAIYAVQAGGGFSHRVSLSGGILIKENHIAAAGSIARAVASVRARAPHLLRLACEVRSLSELRQATDAGVDAVLLDNFSPSDVRAAIKQVSSLARRPVIEVSGGLTAENIAAYAIPGVDVLSTGWITHSVKAVDLSLLVGSAAKRPKK